MNNAGHSRSVMLMIKTGVLAYVMKKADLPIAAM